MVKWKGNHTISYQVPITLENDYGYSIEILDYLTGI